jgi:ABC-type branched-subunit amino acid transport system substrate-binding protein
MSDSTNLRSGAITLSAAMAMTALGVLPGCSDKGSQNPAAPTAANSDTIAIAFIGSQTGGDSAGGIQAQHGAELAVERINAYGGILGKQLRLVEADDQSDSTRTLTLAQQMLSQHIVLGIGPTSDTAAVALNPLITGGADGGAAGSAPVVYISPSASSPALDIPGGSSLTTIAPVLLRTTPTSNHLASAMAQRAANAASTVNSDKCFSAVIVYENDAYGTSIEADVKNLLQQNEILVPTPIPLNADPDDPNLPGVAQSAVAAISGTVSPTLPLASACQVVIAEAQTAGAYMLAYSNATKATAAPGGGAWSAVKTIGSDGFRDPAFITAGRVDPTQTMSTTAGEGSYAVAADTAPTTDEPAEETTQFTSFKELYVAAHPGEDLGQFSSTAYDAVMILAIGIARAGDPTAVDAIRNQAFANSKGATSASAIDMSDFFNKISSGASLNYIGASGPVDFQPTGGVLAPFSVWQVQNAQYVWSQTYPTSELN